MKKIENVITQIANLQPLKIYRNLFDARTHYPSKRNRKKLPVGGVYAFFYKGFFYFGSTTSLNSRLSQHFSDYNIRSGWHPKLHNLFNMVGIENVPVLIFVEGEKLNKESLNLIEITLIHLYSKLGCGVLSEDKYITSSSTRKKRSEAGKGRKHSEETKKKLSDRNGFRVKAIFEDGKSLFKL